MSFWTSSDSGDLRISFAIFIILLIVIILLSLCFTSHPSSPSVDSHPNDPQTSKEEPSESQTVPDDPIDRDANLNEHPPDDSDSKIPDADSDASAAPPTPPISEEHPPDDSDSKIPDADFDEHRPDDSDSKIPDADSDASAAPPTPPISEERQAERDNHIREIDHSLNELSDGNFKVVNFMMIDRLVEVRGKHRPIAVFVRPVSANLSHGGVFVYDAKTAQYHRLYLFFGRESTAALQAFGEIVFERMVAETPNVEVHRVPDDLENEDFKGMIRDIGGHPNDIQSTKAAGDEMFFERCFFSQSLHIHVFANGEHKELGDFRSPTLDLLPGKGSGIVDTSDNQLYLYISDMASDDEQDRQDQLNALQWMNSVQEYRSRQVVIFDKETLPPNLALLFDVTKLAGRIRATSLHNRPPEPQDP